MAKKDEILGQINVIKEVLRAHPAGLNADDIAHKTALGLPKRTLQRRLKSPDFVPSGKGKARVYKLAQTATDTATAAQSVVVPLSPASNELRALVRRPPAAREPVGYRHDFLDAYRPNETFYLTAPERERLAGLGLTNQPDQPAGTHAQHILNRLLIDLAWNSSRLEGNTYSLLDTQRLIEFGEVNEGRNATEAQMILNHKDAIEFLVQAANDIGFDRPTILNLHAKLADNLLDDPAAVGRLRRIVVGIAGSVYHPLAVPQQIEEYFNQLLATATAIRDPFEQAFFVMVQLPYLQPFDDVNKRVSRLAANIPLIRLNLSPISFVDVPKDLYTEAMLAVYEFNRIELLKDLFLWAYERSAKRYAAIRQTLGEPDQFRFRHRQALKSLIADVITSKLGKKAAAKHVAQWAAQEIDANERARFIETVETELMAIHEGNYARYPVRPSQFRDWYAVWTAKPAATAKLNK